jgi:hypothetical protein
MIFMATATIPSDATEEWAKCSFEMASNPLPACIKKWQVFLCSGGDGDSGIKGYNLIFTEKGKGDEALIEINKLMLTFGKIKGMSYKLEPLMSITDSFKVLEKNRVESVSL